MTKKVAFGPKPTPPAAARTPDEWVSNRPASEPEPVVGAPATAADKMKRLTIDVTADLHTRIKVTCTLRGKKIADEIRDLLEQHFPDQSHPAE
jgi:hypothetical protein